MLELDGVRRRSAGNLVLDGVALSVTAEVPVAILGASPAARRALFRLLSGADRPDAGGARLNGVDLSRARCGRSGKSILALEAPWIRSTSSSVRRVLQAAGAAKGAAGDLAEWGGLGEVQNAGARTLDAGQRVRLAVACARVTQPDLIVLDSPVAGLAPRDREALLADLPGLLTTLDAIVVWLAATSGEAEALGGRTVVLEQGKIVQDGPAAQVAAHPATLSVAHAVASPALNTLTLQMEGDAGRLGDGATLLLPRLVGLPATGSCTLAFRPGDLTTERRQPDAIRFVVRIEGASEAGGQFAHALFADARWLLRLPDAARMGGRLVNAFIDPTRLMVFGADGTALSAGPAV